MISTMPVIDIT